MASIERPNRDVLRLVEKPSNNRDSVLDQEAQEANDCMMICVSRACTPRLVLDI